MILTIPKSTHPPTNKKNPTNIGLIKWCDALNHVKTLLVKHSTTLQ
jgi:hypothetical protein